MTGRPVTVRRVALACATLLVVGLALLSVVTLAARATEPSVRVVSEEGGVSVAVPRNWTVDKRHPIDPDHQEFLSGREKAGLGILQRGGFWIARWPARADATTATIEARLREQQQKSPRDHWSIRDDVVAGRAAVAVRYSERPAWFERLGVGGVRLVVRELVAQGYIFQIGTWTRPGIGSIDEELEHVAQSFEVFRPKPWTAHLVDTNVRLRLPGGWVERKSKVDGAILHALAPGDPNEAWAYVFRFATSPRATVRGARANIEANGGVVRSQTTDVIAGRRVPRLDFTFPDGKFGVAQDVEWFVSDGRGGTLVLAVGRRSGDSDIAERIKSGWRSG